MLNKWRISREREERVCRLGLQPIQARAMRVISLYVFLVSGETNTVLIKIYNFLNTLGTQSVFNEILPLLGQDVESENANVVKRLFKIQNINASTIRTVMVAHCRRHDTPDLLLDYEAQSQARTLAQQAGYKSQHQPMLFDLGDTDSGEEEEECEEEEEDPTQGEGKLLAAHLPYVRHAPLEHVLQVRCGSDDKNHESHQKGVGKSGSLC